MQQAEAIVYYFIDPMIETDIERVQEIEQQSFSTHWSANTYRNELRNPSNNRYIVGKASPVPPPPREERNPDTSGRGFLSNVLSVLLGASSETPDIRYFIVGYGGLWTCVDEAHITTIAVDPIYRGRGIGELLLNGLIDQALSTNADLLTLEVRISNVVAQQLYLKYGFHPFGKRTRYYTDNGEDALIMSTDSIQSKSYQERLYELRGLLFERLRQEAADTPVKSATDIAASSYPRRY